MPLLTQHFKVSGERCAAGSSLVVKQQQQQQQRRTRHASFFFHLVASWRRRLVFVCDRSLASLWIREGEKEEKALSIVVAPACSFDALTDFGQPGRKKKRLPPGACKPLHHDVIPYSVIVYFFFKLYCVSLISQKKVWLCAVAKPIQYRYRNLIPLVAFFFVVSFSKTYIKRVFCFFH